MTTRCKMMITFRYHDPGTLDVLTRQQAQRVWQRINAGIFARLTQEAASHLTRLAPDMDGAGGPPDMAGMAARIRTALNAAARQAGGDAEPFGDPVQVPGTQTEYNIHDGVRCCGELFSVRERGGDPWLVQEGPHTAEVMVKFNWESSLDG